MAEDPLPYYQAARFANGKKAGTVYDKLQQLIFIEDCDLSAYRFKLNNVWHVVVIGQKPTDKIHVEVEAQLTNGTLTTLDKKLLSYLMDRRGKAIELGPWIEVHYKLPEE